MKQIPNYPNYFITINGQVWSTLSKKFLKSFPDHNGYLKIRLTVGIRFIHRLIAETYIPNPHNYPIVRHLNDINTDNSIKNLAWGTQKMNGQDMMNNDTQSKGTHRPNSCFTDNEIKDIKSRQYYWGLLSDLAKEFNVDPSTIRAIYRGKSWKHI